MKFYLKVNSKDEKEPKSSKINIELFLIFSYQGHLNSLKKLLENTEEASVVDSQDLNGLREDAIDIFYIQ